MSLTRWQPLREMMALRDAVDRLFDESAFPGGTLARSRGAINPLPLDLIERDEELIVRAAVPGFDPEQIDISLQGDTLTLRGSMETQRKDDEENYHLREYRASSFHRSIRLPAAVDADNATAECKNGVLTLHLPKAERETARRIAVNRSESAEPEQIEVEGQATEQDGS